MKTVLMVVVCNFVGAMPGAWAQSAENLVSPEILDDNSVIFRLEAPNAKSVKLRYCI